MEAALAHLDGVFNERRTARFMGRGEYRALASFGKFMRHASLLASQFRRLAEVLGQPERIQLDPATMIPSASVPLTIRPNARQILRANLTLRSLAFRHALRVALGRKLARQPFANRLHGARRNYLLGGRLHSVAGLGADPAPGTNRQNHPCEPNRRKRRVAGIGGAAHPQNARTTQAHGATAKRGDHGGMINSEA
jgi:hypothetical protein